MHVFTLQISYEKALPLFEACIRIREKLAPGSIELALSYNNLADLYGRMGNHRQQSLEFHRKALAIKEAKFPKSESLVRSYMNICNFSANKQERRDLIQKAEALISDMKQPPATSPLCHITSENTKCEEFVLNF